MQCTILREGGFFFRISPNAAQKTRGGGKRDFFFSSRFFRIRISITLGREALPLRIDLYRTHDDSPDQTFSNNNKTLRVILFMILHARLHSVTGFFFVFFFFTQVRKIKKFSITFLLFFFPTHSRRLNSFLFFFFFFFSCLSPPYAIVSPRPVKNIRRHRYSIENVHRSQQHTKTSCL